MAKRPLSDDPFATHDLRLGPFNRALYELCATMPGHDDAAKVRAKVLIIARAYATGLERHVKNGRKTVEGPIVDALVRGATWLDPALRGLEVKAADGVPRLELLGDIVRSHGRVMAVLAPHMRTAAPRSFVAKYLHFHVPVFPIYDAAAVAKLRTQIRWQQLWTTELLRPTIADLGYWDFCVRVGHLVATWHHGVAPTARNVDTLLLE